MGRWQQIITKLHEVINLYADALPDEVSLLEQIDKTSVIYYEVIDLENVFFPIPTKNYQKYFAFMEGTQQYTFIFML